MKKSYLVALAALALIALWVASGYLFPSSGSGQGRAQDTPAREGEKPFRVRVAEVVAEDFTQELTLHGHTQAWRKVALKAEVDGRVVATPVEKGARVDKGAVLCVLESRARREELAEARARLEQRRLEYEAAKKLAAAGHRARTALAQAKAALMTAQAEVRRKELAVANTRIRAPFSGVVADRPAEVGDYLAVGGVCAELAALDPLLVITSISEADVAHVAVGKPVHVRFLDGRTEEGRIRFVAPTADPATRTFRIEIALANREGRIRDGLTATAILPLKTVKAHRIPASVLVLGPDGRIGVRTVDEDNVVRFYPVTILQDAGRAIWVGGLPERVRLITVGQDFVHAGETVETVPDRDFAHMAEQQDGAILPPRLPEAVRAQGDEEKAS
ncbi:MAG: efflux RND transporter periplasmic adaptor subunit [Alphaproteobacteria bacterium]|nr:MAG: efflux RND transporter periplasmic adaptor subunit [Alphaproteobacteria bacterium]